jgi:hypothetical protein
MLGFFVLAALVLSLPSASPAAGLPSMTLGDALAAGNLTIPAAWSGIWSVADTSHACGDPTLETDVTVDTLCTGAPVVDDPFDILDCTGSTVDDVSANVNCAGFVEFPGCRIDVSLTIVAARNGDSYVATSTSSQTFTPTGCGGVDECTVTESTGTRIGPEPPDCQTPVDASTWGLVKSRYR